MSKQKISTLAKRDRHLVIGVDTTAWRAAAGKLSLKESGELVRALVRAQSAKKPNRDQRMLLAVFTRDPTDGAAA